MLKLHNTLTGRKEPFEPLRENHVGMYVCGVTVYDECHLGHARSAMVFEVLRNYLQFSGYTVRFVRNFTDVDDKIINRAAQEGIGWQQIVERYLEAYRRDMGRLRIIPADVEPKATEHIQDIVTMIGSLIAKGHAYQANGDVYYQVETYPQYGRLSKRKQEDLLAGARVEVDERKRNPMDFALWKASKPGEPAWESPWGMGRPGWHIECSAMSVRHLGETFDIHGGGMDLIFPHHENEIAQSSAATGKEFARYWVHNGFVEVNKEKMSKSLGNFFTIREVFEKCAAYGWREELTAEVLRYFLLGTHYRSPVDFSDRSMQEAKSALDNMYNVLGRLEEITEENGPDDHLLIGIVNALDNSFRLAMDDDLNTPGAIAKFQSFRSDLNKLLARRLSREGCMAAKEALRRHGAVLGLFQIAPKDWQFNVTVSGSATISYEALKEESANGTSNIERTKSNLSDSEIEQLLKARREARQHKDFARADEIRKQLAAQGITIEDRPDGTSRWKR